MHSHAAKVVSEEWLEARSLGHRQRAAGALGRLDRRLRNIGRGVLMARGVRLHRRPARCTVSFQVGTTSWTVTVQRQLRIGRFATLRGGGYNGPE
jgi:hypothetical protein